METRSRAYYEQPELWAHEEENLSERLHVIDSLIPNHIKTVLDVGCGNGSVANHLAARFRTIGLDSSQQALLQVGTDKLRSSSATLPFKDRSVDLVLLSDVLEHLPESVLTDTIREAMRVSRAYLLIVSPHNENLAFSQVKCDDCGCIYHMNYHVRSVALRDLEQWFGGDYRLQTYSFWGTPWLQYDPRVWELRQHLADEWCRWPLAVCPMCGGKPAARPSTGKAETIKALLDDLNLTVMGQQSVAWEQSPPESEVAALFARRDVESARASFLTTAMTAQASGIDALPACLLSPVTIPRDLLCATKIRLRFKKRVNIDVGSPDAVRASTGSPTRRSYLCRNAKSVWGKSYVLDGRMVRNYLYSSDPERHAIFVIPKFTQDPFTVTLSYKDMASDPVGLFAYDHNQGYLRLGQLENKKDGQWKETTFIVPSSIAPPTEGFLFNLEGQFSAQDQYYAIARIVVSGAADEYRDVSITQLVSEPEAQYLFLALPWEARFASGFDWIVESPWPAEENSPLALFLSDGTAMYCLHPFFNHEAHQVQATIPPWWIHKAGQRKCDSAASLKNEGRNHDLEFLRHEFEKKQAELEQAHRLLNSKLVRTALGLRGIWKRFRG
jgi:SAM-dependent methyltransferase